ncbi:hypothetical protein ACFQ3J_22590 [Paenibacillus provencensis]|uniref:Uncharacterized protein n=1 Tax=Paenibacillus provencensis TaxID=441151 RepID=A0ABW3PY33_9BACL
MMHTFGGGETLFCAVHSGCFCLDVADSEEWWSKQKPKVVPISKTAYSLGRQRQKSSSPLGVEEGDVVALMGEQLV